jgi:hypothetical protein
VHSAGRVRSEFKIIEPPKPATESLAEKGPR